MRQAQTQRGGGDVSSNCQDSAPNRGTTLPCRRRCHRPKSCLFKALIKASTPSMKFALN